MRCGPHEARRGSPAATPVAANASSKPLASARISGASIGALKSPATMTGDPRPSAIEASISAWARRWSVPA